MDIPYFKLRDIVCTWVTFIPDICVEFHINEQYSTLMSSVVSTHTHVAAQELLSSGVNPEIQHVQKI